MKLSQQIVLAAAVALAQTSAAADDATEPPSPDLPGAVGKVGDSLGRVGQAAATRVEEGVESAKQGVEQGAKTVADKLSRGLRTVESGVERGVKGTAEVVENVADKISGAKAPPEEK